MRHYWKNIDGTEVLINANDDKSPLAWINCVDGKYLLSVPHVALNKNIKDDSEASSYSTLDEAKQAAKNEIQWRIDQFISPAN